MWSFIGSNLWIFCSYVGNINILFLNPKAFYFGIYSLIPPTLAVISAGALSEGKWKYSAIILIVGLLLFYLTDVGRVAFYYPYLSTLALLLILIFREKISKLLFSKDWKK